MTNDAEALDLPELLGVLEANTAAIEKLQTRIETLTADSQTIADVLYQHLGMWPADNAAGSADVESADVELAEWVRSWLIPTFALGQQLDSWEEVPALWSELRALRLGYLEMAKSDVGFNALAWHDYLDRVVARIPAHREHLQYEQNADRFSLGSA